MIFFFSKIFFQDIAIFKERRAAFPRSGRLEQAVSRRLAREWRNAQAWRSQSGEGLFSHVEKGINVALSYFLQSPGSFWGSFKTPASSHLEQRQQVSDPRS
ncbi:hypothetical protein CHARACLAT_006045 [Characodon lateralis]|uniref:Uncharacterized protein n=1 Tax=Characodon lateralis TaxID=208331 RepID=A0ABU7CVQ3_9TELE|nr:hypothetical protein [Characodon lateralis]